MSETKEQATTPIESGDPSPKYETFNDWSLWTNALAEWLYAAWKKRAEESENKWRSSQASEPSTDISGGLDG